MGRGTLTQKQETFCLQYFRLGNATKAALIAGYNSRNARIIAAENLSKLNIQTRLGALRQAAEDASIASVVERKQVLTEIVRGRFSDFFDKKLTRKRLKSAALQEIRITEFVGGKDGRAHEKTTTIKLNNPVQAIAELNKMEKIYTEGTIVNVDNRKIEIFVVSETARDLTNKIAQGERTE